MDSMEATKASKSGHTHSLARKEKRRHLEISFMSSYGDLTENKESWKFLI